MVIKVQRKRGAAYFMNVAICDDEIIFMDILEKELRRYAGGDDVSLRVKRFQSSELLLRSDISGFDAIFLDIEMPGVNGMETARRLRERSEDLIIVFVTSYIEYAPAGYRVGVFRYLLKKNIDQELRPCMDEIWEKVNTGGKLVSLQAKGRTLEVAARNILYFEGTTRRTVLVHLKQSEKAIECVGKLADFEERLQGLGFLRLQNSYLANMDNILMIRNYQAVLRNGEELKVSERRNAQVQKEFLAWRSHTI